ncbi:hypothetical protein [Mycolicibacterium sp. HS_4_1]
MVLSAQSGVNRVSVTWVAVAPGYGAPVAGAGIELGVEEEPMLEAVAQLFGDAIPED